MRYRIACNIISIFPSAVLSSAFGLHRGSTTAGCTSTAYLIISSFLLFSLKLYFFFLFFFFLISTQCRLAFVTLIE
jgi:hypothetical protein